MRIGLLNGGTLYPLAGQSGVGERTHSSAADFELTPESSVQVAAFVRGTYARPIDRGNLLNRLSFTTSRLFASPAAAQLWCLDYHSSFPSSGTLIIESVMPFGQIIRRHMVDCVVDPPRRRCTGATALIDYSVRGGAIVPASADMLVTGTLTSDGTTPLTFPPLLYSEHVGGKPAYSNDAVISGATHRLYWDSFSSEWYLVQISPYALWISSSDVATPDLATGWGPFSPNTGTPVITAAT